MNITNEGLDLIKEFEGWRANAYRDAVGVWTIGYGHTSMAGEPSVRAGMVITEAEGHAILARDVETFAAGVRKAVTVQLTDAQFSALVSFAYNVGLGNLRKSSVLAAVNRRDFAAVPRRLQQWTKAGGKVLPGLVRRRAAEADMFAAGSVKPVADVPVQDVPAVAPETGAKPANVGAAGAGAVVAGGAGAVAAGVDWKLVVLGGGVLLVLLVVAVIIFKKRSAK